MLPKPSKARFISTNSASDLRNRVPNDRRQSVVLWPSTPRHGFTMPKLVIVESPAKAKTISQFLGGDYRVEASFGHVRDLPDGADGIPEELKKKKWARLGVNVESNFEPIYVVPDDKRRHVDVLKKALKGADALLLATDEDREGESISWHILELLKPGPKTRVQRIVFHEITPEAIQAALKSPRDVDQNLVRAQETRRIVDRLYGYTLSPLLWKKVAPKLSAGRVQSVATRLTVLRERERLAFKNSVYWDLEAGLTAAKGSFDARLKRVGDRTVATGRSFDPATGELKDRSILLDQEAAEALARAAEPAKPWTVTDLETNPGQEKPPAPFMTSTLQQEANRKLGFDSRRTMQIAQQLYEGIELKGERVGLITYMRTDSLTLAERALVEARDVIRDLYGPEYLPAKGVQYKTKSKNAQEAHEAIRPTDLARRPEQVKSFLSKDQFALYDLIWKRTIACQMLPAQVQRTVVEVTVKTDQNLVFGASGKAIIFPGFLRAYVEGSDDPEIELESQETILPEMKIGDVLDLKGIKALRHETRPPARYTEASLVKKLEEEGIGRPSTYASIIGTIQDRGYVIKKGKELVPTFTAFAVTELLEEFFEELVDLKFTAQMEDELDDIAEGRIDSTRYLRDFYDGHDGNPGLVKQIEAKEKEIPFPSIELGSDEEGRLIVVRVGKFGAFVQRGEGGEGHRANIPPQMAPAELTLEAAIELLNGKSAGAAAIGVDPESGRNVFWRTGRYGDYLEVEQTEEEKKAGEKPRRVTLPKAVKAGDISESDLSLLLLFPRDLGPLPGTGEPVTVTIGAYGPYVKSGAEIRNIDDWREAARIELEEAAALLAQPKSRRGSTAAPRAAISAIQEFGVLDGASGPVRVLPGRFGPYVTDGKVNATLPKNLDPATVTADEAMELIRAKAAAPKTAKRGWGGKRKAKRSA